MTTHYVEDFEEVTGQKREKAQPVTEPETEPAVETKVVVAPKAVDVKPAKTAEVK